MKLKNGVCWIVIYCLLVQALYIHFLLAVSLQFDSRYSTIQLNSGATFDITNAISSFNGTLIKNAGATISGQNITFSSGIYEVNGNQAFMTGVLDTTGPLKLTGNHTLRGESGLALPQLDVSGIGNRLEGQSLFSGAITLQNASAALTIAIHNTLNQNIVLGGGILTLDSDLRFVDQKTCTGNGTIDLNGNNFILGGAPLTWSSTIQWNNAGGVVLNNKLNLTGAFTFSGTNNIQGNGNVIDLSSGGSIIVAATSTLYLTDIVIRGLGVSGGSLTLSAADSVVRMSNVTLEFVGNMNTTQGTIYIEGPTIAVIKNHTWTINTLGDMTVDGVTLWKDTAGAQVPGDIVFGTPESSFLTLLATGVIKIAGNVSGDDFSALDGRVTTNESNISTFQSDVTTAQSDITTSQGNITVLQSDMTTEQSNISTLQSNMTTAQSNISTLQSDMTTAQGDINTSQGNITKLQSNMTT